MQELTKPKPKLKLKAMCSEMSCDAVLLSTDARCMSLSSATTLRSIVRQGRTQLTGGLGPCLLGGTVKVLGLKLLEQ